MDQDLGRVTRPGRQGILMELVNVKAHRTKKEMKNTWHFEKFVTEGHEKADELAKEGDEGFMAEARAKNCAAGKRGGVRSFAVCSQLPLLGRTMEGL